MAQTGHLTEADFPKTHNLNATTAPTVNNDVDEGYVPGSTWVDTTNSITYVCIDNTDGAAVWQQSSNAGVRGARIDSLSWATDSTDYIQSGNQDATFSSLAAFEFHGSDAVGTPTTIKVLYEADSASPAHSLEIFDFTNSLIIASVTGITTTGRYTLDMGTISNVDTDPAQWQIRAKRDAVGNVKIRLSSISIQF